MELKKRIIFELDGWQFFSESSVATSEMFGFKRHWARGPTGTVYSLPYYLDRLGHGQFHNFVKTWFRMME